MSKESYSWLAENVRAGFTEEREPWWAPAARREGSTPHLYPGAVPMEEVEKLLAGWSPYESGLFDVTGEAQTFYDADMKPVRAILAETVSPVRSHKLIKTDDTHEQLAVVGIDRATHSYRDWLVGTVTECVGDEAQVSSAGLLKNRAQAWVQIERPETAVGPDGILFSPHVTLSTSLDSSLSSQINQNTKMVICDNTLEIARGQGLAFRHTKNSGQKLGDYRSVMSAIMRGESDFRAELDRQLKVEVSDTDFSRFLESFVPIHDDDHPAKKTRSERKRREITELYKSDPRVLPWKGTEFGVVQAVNTWQQHLSQLTNKTGYEMDDTNLRAMRNYAEDLRGNQGRDMETVKLLEAVLV
jgi:phage/plasmid-like protein (TIGR03299 family)